MTDAELERRLWNLAFKIPKFPIFDHDSFTWVFTHIRSVKRLSDNRDLHEYLDYLEAQLLFLLPSITD